MDIASKIKIMKEELQKMEDEKNAIEEHVKELRDLVDQKKKKEAKLEELRKIEAELLASL